MFCSVYLPSCNRVKPIRVDSDYIIASYHRIMSEPVLSITFLLLLRSGGSYRANRVQYAYDLRETRLVKIHFVLVRFCSSFRIESTVSGESKNKTLSETGINRKPDKRKSAPYTRVHLWRTRTTFFAFHRETHAHVSRVRRVRTYITYTFAYIMLRTYTLARACIYGNKSGRRSLPYANSAQSKHRADTRVQIIFITACIRIYVYGGGGGGGGDPVFVISCRY